MSETVNSLSSVSNLSSDADDSQNVSVCDGEDGFSSSDDESNDSNDGSDSSSGRSSVRRLKRHRVPAGVGASSFRPLYLLDQIAHLEDSENLSDILFVVGKGDQIQQFHAHRLILSACSQIFHAMCYPRKNIPIEKSEKRENQTIENNRTVVDENSPLLILLPEEEPQVFELVLHSIYGDGLPMSALNAEVLPKLLAASRKYGVERLTCQCIQQLEQFLSITTCLGLYSCSNVLLNDSSFGRLFISENISEIVKSHSWLHLLNEQISEILSWNSLDVDELTLFYAAIRWAQFQEAKKLKQIEEKNEKLYLDVEAEYGLPKDATKESKNPAAPATSSSPIAESPLPSLGVGRGRGRGRGYGRGGLFRGRGGYAAAATSASAAHAQGGYSSMIKGSKAATAHAKSIYSQYREWHWHDPKPGSFSHLLSWLAPLLPLIRFPLMSVEEVATHIQPASLLPREDLLLLFRYVSLKDTDEFERNRIRHSEKFHFEYRQRDSAGFASKSLILPATHRMILKKMFKDKTTKRNTSVKIAECLWRGSRDGFLVSKFHELCDGKGATITIIKSTNGWIFGGFHGESWTSAAEYHHHSDSWLFTFGPPTASKIKAAKLLPAVTSGAYNDANYGPTFGNSGSGNDLYVQPNMKTNANSCSASSYITVDEDYQADYPSVTESTLAGAYAFAVDDIEVLSCKFYG